MADKFSEIFSLARKCSGFNWEIDFLVAPQKAKSYHLITITCFMEFSLVGRSTVSIQMTKVGNPTQTRFM